MKPSIVFVGSLTAILSASAQTLPSLLDALRASGASMFADQIDADPTIAAVYLSDQVQTVFAPIDNAYVSNFTRLAKRQSLTPTQQQALLLQCTQGQATLQSMRTLPGGSNIVTQDHTAKLKGKAQSVVSDPRPKNATKPTKPTKRGLTRPLYSSTWTASTSHPPTWNSSEPYPLKTWTASESYPPTWNASAPHPPIWNTSEPHPPKTWPYPSKTYTPSPLPPPTATPSPPSLVEIFSGLGNSVNVIRADIPYAGGYIQITDNIFTLPASLSATVQATGESTFASLANSANLTDAFDNIPYSTFFIPSDEAFANANASPSAATANLLSGHVIPNFVGYLPSLVNGSTLTTQAGSSVTVTVQGNNYYINDALIVSSNLILENGVAHVIDQVLSPSPQVFQGAASSIREKGAMGAFTTAVAAAALFLAKIF